MREKHGENRVFPISTIFSECVIINKIDTHGERQIYEAFIRI